MAAIACPEYEAIWRKGYGPEGGEKLDKAGWEKYLDEMAERDREAYDLMLEDVYTPPRPQPWLDDLDKTLTHVCPAFAHNPEYQLIWQKGYGPTPAQGLVENMGAADWDKYVHEVMDPEERANMLKHVFPTPPNNNNYNKTPTSEELEQAYRPGGACYNYSKHIKQSQGFDIVDFPGPGMGATIVPLFKHMSMAKDDEELIDCSKEALNVYNKEKGTHYKLHQVVKANIKYKGGYALFITFEAVDLDKLDVFQAKVFKPIRKPHVVQLVRLKELQMEPVAP